MDSTAWNFNPAATVSDTSCQYGCPVPGVVAVTLPYLGVGLTNCGSGNDLTSANASTGTALTYYLNGEDATYEFTATGTTDIIVDLVGTASYSAIFVYDACPSLGGVVVALSASSAMNENCSFTPVSGTTYFVTIDTWASPTCIPSYDLSISEAVVGCMNPLATNYDPLANVACASCCVMAGCTSGIGANSESFEDPAVPLYGQGPWANWVYDAASSTFTLTNGWRKDNLGTSSGKYRTYLMVQPSLDGDYYLYCETFWWRYGNAVANLHSSCVDLNNFVSPSFVFGYNMEGATMGVLNVDVSTDGGGTWTNEWTLSGNQGAGWNEGLIDLSTSYAGQMVQLRMNYTSGTSFTGDCAIDYLRFMESPIGGCMDQWAANYNSAATIDDGSCMYPGCTDPMAVNYCSTCNADCDTITGGTNTSCCIYPVANASPMCEDFESANFNTNSWVTNNGPDCSVGLNAGTFSVNPAAQIIGALNDTVSLHFEGASTTAGWTNLGATEAAAYSNTSHIATATILMDLTNAASACEMSFNVELYSGFSNARYCNLRVKVDGVVIPDNAGHTSYWTGTASPIFPYGPAGAAHAAVYNMSAYSGQTVNVTFEYVGRYGSGYSSGVYGCHAQVDNICFYDLTPCYYFEASTSVDASPQCNGDLTGAATASAANGSGSYSYLWDNGATTASISGVAAGTYMVVATDDSLGCVDSTSVTIGEPTVKMSIF